MEKRLNIQHKANVALLVDEVGDTEEDLPTTDSKSDRICNNLG